ncbi:MAG: hypothetical protein DRJ03_03395 [Chloroflexi bacterium]|nr:MAG: hypothetical protein DRJ03_03395 [Chloroflexota bacterium]
MMQERCDGSMSEIFNISEKDKLSDVLKDANTKLLHQGTKEELEKLKAEREFLIARFDRIESKLDALIIHLRVPTSGIVVSKEMPSDDKLRQGV